MPNWNWNSVEIEASHEEIKPFFVEEPVERVVGNDVKLGKQYRFNMAKIFPEKFPEDDAIGYENWDYDWMCQHTGSKWSPVIGCGDDFTQLQYDSAWAPNNETLLKLSEITGWEITNEYEEPGNCFEGTYICKAGEVLLNDQREYRNCCEMCDEKYDGYEVEDPDDERTQYLCSVCIKKDKNE